MATVINIFYWAATAVYNAAFRSIQCKIHVWGCYYFNLHQKLCWIKKRWKFFTNKRNYHNWFDMNPSQCKILSLIFSQITNFTMAYYAWSNRLACNDIFKGIFSSVNSSAIICTLCVVCVNKVRSQYCPLFSTLMKNCVFINIFIETNLLNKCKWQLP